jgi:hypothetical protein
MYSKGFIGAFSVSNAIGFVAEPTEANQLIHHPEAFIVQSNTVFQSTKTDTFISTSSSFSQ